MIDPNEVSSDTLKNDVRVLAIAAQHQHILSFDNISGISSAVSDALCRMSTGGGFRTRQLFKDEQEVLFKFKRPVLINGIGDLATRPDLLERAITVLTPPITAAARRREKDVYKEFGKVRQGVLGALLEAASLALANQDSIQVTEAVRMADFLAFVEAGEPALGFPPGTIRSAYVANQAEANEVALEESQVATLIRNEFNEYWEGSATELLEKISPNQTRQERKRNGWPTTAVTMSNALKRVEPNLAGAGITVRRWPTGRKRMISISKRVVTLVMSSSMSSTGNDNYDDFIRDGNSVAPGRTVETFDD